jgi:hypothetical protein
MEIMGMGVGSRLCINRCRGCRYISFGIFGAGGEVVVDAGVCGGDFWTGNFEEMNNFGYGEGIESVLDRIV